MRGDNPVSSRTEDRLGRAQFADRITAMLRGAPADRGLVVGLMGPWGSGKTSVLNMVREGLQRSPERTVLAFNPWMFSGSEQLVRAFFEQVSAQLRLKKRAAERELASQLAEYGQAGVARGSLCSADVTADGGVRGDHGDRHGDGREHQTAGQTFPLRDSGDRR